MNRKMVNRAEPTTSLAQKIDSGVQLFGAMKGLYSVGKSVFDTAKIAAPYIARAASLI